MSAKTTTSSGATGRDLAAEIAYLTRALKAPALRESVTRLAERARAEGWTHEEFLVACLHAVLTAHPTPAAREPARSRTRLRTCLPQRPASDRCATA